MRKRFLKKPTSYGILIGIFLAMAVNLFVGSDAWWLGIALVGIMAIIVYAIMCITD